MASLLGCLLPARNAIRIAVPSGRLGHRTKDIIEIQKDMVDLEIPLKVEEIERESFRKFLEHLAVEYSDWFLRFSSPYVKETKEGTLYEITVDYIIDEPTRFLLSILAKPDADLKVTIQPAEYVKTKKNWKWTHKQKNNIYRLSPILRQELLKFTEIKRRSQVTFESDHSTEQ